MKVFRSRSALVWSALEGPSFKISSDWEGNAVDPPPLWGLEIDATSLWFSASHDRPARDHPGARPGEFTAGLWEWDVAELFLADPFSGRYLEFNLAPNGAWWSCEFDAPREASATGGAAFPGVRSFARSKPGGGWLAGLRVPLETLRKRIRFEKGTRANVTFILGSPKSRFLSANPLGEGPPDFHRPQCFPEIRF